MKSTVLEPEVLGPEEEKTYSRIHSYSSSYSEDAFWKKLSSFAKIGKELVRKVLELYYAAQHPDMPMKMRLFLYAALGYFICPIDFVPDIMPLFGYADDAAFIAAALSCAAAYIDDSVRAKADAKIRQWFG